MLESTPRLDVLLREVNCCCLLRRGRKAELARFLGVRPSQVNEWLTSQRAHPSAEYALGMAVWLGEQLDADDAANQPIKKDGRSGPTRPGLKPPTDEAAPQGATGSKTAPRQ